MKKNLIIINQIIHSSLPAAFRAHAALGSGRRRGGTDAVVTVGGVGSGRARGRLAALVLLQQGGGVRGRRLLDVLPDLLLTFDEFFAAQFVQPEVE